MDTPVGYSSAIQLSAQAAARDLKLPVQLILAVVQVESSGNVYAWNPEPAYRYLYDVARKCPFRALTPLEAASEIPPNDFPTLVGDRDAEWWGQQASWGPMQVMGAVARELGLVNHFPSLCDSNVGIVYGSRHLAQLRDRYLQEFGWQGVIAAYNAGSPRRDGGGFVNQVYVGKIAKAGGFKGL